MFSTKGNNWNMFFCKGLVYHFACYFDYPLFLYHAHFGEEPFVLFYHDDTVDVPYKYQVDDMISVVVHDNNLWHLMFC